MRVTFLGQAGVLLEASSGHLLVDPFLTDAMNAPTGGMWKRALPIPVDVRGFIGAAAVVCTHEHGDHLDPLTVAPLLAISPMTALMAPCAAVEDLPWLVDPSQVVGMRGEDDLHQFGPFRVRSIPAAHSADYGFEHDARRGHRWCSVVIEVEGVRIFHSGDTVDYPGFAERIGRVDVALVSINGRGREGRGIVGNMDAAEAADLCRRLQARDALAMHWDMFEVNPGDPEEFSRHLAHSGIRARYGPPMTAFTVEAEAHPS